MANEPEPQGTPLFPTSSAQSRGRTPADWAAAIADVIRAGLRITAWCVLAAAGAAAGYVAIRGILWAVKLANVALGGS
jgi:hypothetical protein